MSQQQTLPASACDIAARLQKGDVTSADLVTAFYQHLVEQKRDTIFIRLTRERATEEALKSDARRQRGESLGPLDGIPIIWKDLFHMKGESTSAGAKVYKDAPSATKDSTVVDACKRLGLISLGKSNMSEFAYSGLGLNPHFGTPGNPNSPGNAHAPGGSSSGSAVAVAAGLAPLAVGTDTAGSVRVPASFCGIAGFKSSQARYPMQDVYPLSASLDSLGGFAHTVEDLILLDAAMRGENKPHIQKSTLKELEFLIPDTIVFDGADADVIDRFDAFAGRLKKAGATIRTQPFPLFSEITALFKVHGTLAVAEAFTYHNALLMGPGADQMDQRVRERMLTATNFSARDYITLKWEKERLTEKVRDILNGAFLLFPTTAITAPRIDVLEASDAHFKEVNLLTLRNTMLGSYLDTPGVSLPIGRDQNGLPVGALISAPSGDDNKVLAAAWAAEDVCAG